MFLLLEYIKKLFVFIFNDVKNESTQTPARLQKQFNDQIIQTEPVFKKEFVSIDMQTDIKLLDIHEDNEWNNLTWSKSIPINQNLMDII